MKLEGKLALAMEYVAGPTLRERLREGPLALSEAAAIAAGLLEALAHAHGARTQRSAGSAVE